MEESNKEKIDGLVNSIDNQLYADTKEKLDIYSKTMIRGLVMANIISNEPLVLSNKKLGERISELEKRLKSGTNPVNNYYDNLSPSAAFMLKWGWGIYTLLISLVIAAAIFITKPAHLAAEQKFVFDKIQIVKGKGYFIPESEFENYKEKGKESGILIPLPPSEKTKE